MIVKGSWFIQLVAMMSNSYFRKIPMSVREFVVGGGGGGGGKNLHDVNY